MPDTNPSTHPCDECGRRPYTTTLGARLLCDECLTAIAERDMDCERAGIEAVRDRL